MHTPSFSRPCSLTYSFHHSLSKHGYRCPLGWAVDCRANTGCVLKESMEGEAFMEIKAIKESSVCPIQLMGPVYVPAPSPSAGVLSVMCH